ncbi:MAG: dethiobiotin synthase [Gammaproteobacteria bacterium]
MTARGFFVTGTDTNAGKTWIAAGLLSALGARGHSTATMKPIASGCTQTPNGLRNDDALLLMRHASLPLPYECVNPYAFAAPVAPHIAAQASGRVIEIAPLKMIFEKISSQADYVIVEGVGGWKVPINVHETTVDLAVALNLPVILVVGMRLGCLNHALLTCNSIVSYGLTLAGWVANTIDTSYLEFDANVQALHNRIPAPLLGITPHLPHFDAGRISQALAMENLMGVHERFTK